MQPILVTLTIPSGTLHYESDQPWTPPQAQAGLRVLAGWTIRIREWIRREVGLSFTYSLRVNWSRRTLSYLANGRLDQYGEGIDWGRVRDDALRDRFGPLGVLVPRSYRIAVFIVGGGSTSGVPAGGAYQRRLSVTHGWAVLGDWFFREALTGTKAPGCLGRYTEAYCVAAEGPRVYGHEWLHMMGVDSHDPETYLGDRLTATQKRDLLTRNGGFLT